MGAVGKDYLACTAARSGAGCSNRKSIRRYRLEEVVVEGLKVRLMAPEVVQEFITAFNNELNCQRSNDELSKIEHRSELVHVTKKLKGLYDAIVDGLRRQAELQRLIATEPGPQPRLHPKLAEVYRAMVSDLHGALNHPDARQEAAEILRGLIAQVAVKPESDGYSVELTGDIIKLVTLPNGDVPESYASSVRWLRGLDLNQRPSGYENKELGLWRHPAKNDMLQVSLARSSSSCRHPRTCFDIFDRDQGPSSARRLRSQFERSPRCNFPAKVQ
jgi:hypothetical protein